jgi:NAD(P)-dependent dehydrogenase (short-subunit alcohol dehydrogenase family)
MDLQLTGKVAVVTGASGEIGAAVARQLADEGMALTLVARSLLRLEELAGQLQAFGVTVLPTSADITNAGAVRAMACTVERRFGRCDVLVNAAAAPMSSNSGARLADIHDQDIMNDFNTKVLGAFRCVQALAPLMVANGGGHVINISGLNARRTGSLSGSIRNVAVSAMAKNLADELGPSGINVTVVHPGVVDSPAARERLARRAAESGRSLEEYLRSAAERSSLRRLAGPEDIASIVAFLASARSAAITGDAVAAACGDRGAIYY